MEFKVFAKKLKNVIGGKSNTKIFTKTIFETMMNESGPELLNGTSPDTFKAYFNGNTSISKVAALTLANLSEDDEFPTYLEGFGDTTAQLLADEFKDDIPDINAVNASTKITDLFLDILREASGKRKYTPKGQLFTDVNEIRGYENVPNLVKKYNRSLWFGHRPKSDLILEYNQVFINEYKIDTCTIIKKLQELSSSGIENYQFDVEFWLLFDDYVIDCPEKKQIINKIFSESKVGVIYGSAGVGKSTLINHVSHYLNDENKLYLTQTNPAKENLTMKINADNTTFSTIASFLKNGSSITEYELLVIDECSTVSNKDMVAVLEKANFKMLLLVGDTYQIDAIQFGNWFSVLKSFLPESAVFELTKPHRTHDKYLLEL